MFDWARTVWPVMIVTFVFPYYFANHVATTPEQGSLYWADTMVYSGILIGIMAPVIGGISDTMKNSTPWFRLFSIINILCAYGLWFVLPSPEYVPLGMALVVLGTIGLEISGTFYNSYLSLVTKPSELSRISGLAWGLGYIAGIFCLVLCLGLLVLPKEPLFGYLSNEDFTNIRIIGPIVGTWYLLFGGPMLMLKDASANTRTSIPLFQLIKATYRKFIDSIKKTKETPYIFYFLIYRMIYTDGINTLFLFAGLYASSTFGMGFDEIMIFGIACNLSAGLGCLLASYTDSAYGEHKTICMSIILLAISIVVLLSVTTLFYFWIFALIATLFVGPLQTSSRSLMAKICPEESKGEFFGLYALSGRITSFLGPAAYRFVTQSTESPAAGMSTILIFLAVGLIGMLYLRIPQAILLPPKTD